MRTPTWSGCAIFSAEYVASLWNQQVLGCNPRAAPARTLSRIGLGADRPARTGVLAGAAVLLLAATAGAARHAPTPSPVGRFCARGWPRAACRHPGRAPLTMPGARRALRTGNCADLRLYASRYGRTLEDLQTLENPHRLIATQMNSDAAPNPRAPPPPPLQPRPGSARSASSSPPSRSQSR